MKLGIISDSILKMVNIHSEYIISNACLFPCRSMVAMSVGTKTQSKITGDF